MAKRKEKNTPSMLRFAIAATALTACGHVITTNAQSPDGDGVIVDVESCVSLETREQQLECYEERVNEVLRRRDAETDATDPDTVTADDAAVAPLPEPVTEIAPEPVPEPVAATVPEPAPEAAAGPEPVPEPVVVAAPEPVTETEDEERGAERTEIIAIVTTLREIEPNAYLISLDNGQVWRQNPPRAYQLEVGTEVRLRSTRWGPSYELSNPNVRGFIRVRRVQ